jgi:hypothetical protein
MRKFTRRFALVSAAAFAASMLLSSSFASADNYREFTGQIDKLKKTKFIVDNRKGDKVSFNRADATTVEGEKKDWGKIKKDDWVSVSWKMMDKPRIAYKVVVMPPKEEAGDDD